MKLALIVLLFVIGVICFAEVIAPAPVAIVPACSNMIRIQCQQSVFTNYQWSAWVSQDMKQWWEFPQASPENRLITFIPGAQNTYVRLVGKPKGN